jgi:NAD(P)-dependent dehydrogenase (short-subunit alcohol dehydrogenase family)
MDQFANRVAVVTGGGSGIGAAMAKAFARLGSKIVLADVDEKGMDRVRGEIEGQGGAALGVRTDVTRLEEVQALAERTFAHFGAAHILCNNAGVATFGPLATATHKDWQWTMNVNFWGVVHGIEVFLPRLLEQQQGGHVVNTASMAGIVGMPGLGVYAASKFAVVGLTESLARELKGTGIGASVLCPMIVKTAINQSERNRPADLRNETPSPIEPAVADGQYTIPRTIEPEEVADRVVEAIRQNSLYVFTHRESREIVRHRAERLAKAADRLATA